MCGSNRTCILRLAAALAVLSVSFSACYSQFSREAFRKFLIEKVELTSENLATLDRKQVVVKVQPVRIKEEISVFGIIRLSDLPRVALRNFRDGLDQNNTGDYAGGGKLRRPPTLQDLSRLRFEDRDLEDLKVCVAGNCKVKLPATFIDQLHNDLDRNAPGYKAQASDKLKRFLVEYAADYLKRGNDALIEYADKSKRVKLTDQYPILVKDLELLDQAAPEFKEYILRYPVSELDGVEDTLDWSKVRSGLKPVISITHGSSYAKQMDNGSILFVATKQLYANHYVDASMTLASLVQFPTGETAETYLIFDNRSQSDALGGLLGEMVRGLTEKEAVKRVKELLQRAGQRIETKAQTIPEAQEIQGEEGLLLQILGMISKPVVLTLVAILVASAIIFLFGRSRRRKNR